MTNQQDITEAELLELVLTEALDGRPVETNSGNLDVAAMQYVNVDGKLVAQAIYVNGRPPIYRRVE